MKLKLAPRPSIVARVSPRVFGVSQDDVVMKAGDVMTGPLTMVGGGHWTHTPGLGAGSWYDSVSVADRFFAGTDASTDAWRICTNDGDTNVLSIDGTTELITVGTMTGTWQETSTVIGSLGAFWNPNGAAIVHKFNRILVGEAALGGTGAPPSPMDWMEDLLSGTVQNGQLSVVSAIGLLGIFGASRTSDWRTASGGASGGTQGVTGIAYNDDDGAGGPIACGVNAVGIAASTVTTGSTINQFDINNAGPVVTLTPNAASGVAGETIALLVTSGAYSALAPNNVSAAISIAQGSVGQFNKGIIFAANAFDTSIGGGGAGVAMELAAEQSLRWLNASNVTLGEIYCDNSGIINIDLATMSLNATGPTYSFTCAAGVKATGYATRAGVSGAYGGNSFNINHSGTQTLWVDTTNVGTFAYTSDYRIKKDVIDLPGMWDTVKALRPIKYTQAQFSPPSHVEYAADQLEKVRENAEAEGKPKKGAVDIQVPGHLYEADDIERWGFIAHELQATLTPSASSGVKDSPDTIQSPNPFTLIAALTKALQEAMARIEVLEEKL